MATPTTERAAFTEYRRDVLAVTETALYDHDPDGIMSPYDLGDTLDDEIASAYADGCSPHDTAAHLVDLIVSGRQLDAVNDPVRCPDVYVQLTGEDGNAFYIIGRVTRAMHRAGYSREMQDEYRTAAMAGDYANVIATTMQWVEVG